MLLLTLPAVFALQPVVVEGDGYGALMYVHATRDVTDFEVLGANIDGRSLFVRVNGEYASVDAGERDSVGGAYIWLRSVYWLKS